MQKRSLITDFQILKVYGYNYYTAFIPSKNKLREKLFERSKDDELTDKVLEELSLFIDEATNIKNYIRYYKTRNKNLSYIQQKLLEKKFKKDEVVQILNDEIVSTGESILTKEYIHKKIHDLKEKGKSKNAIRQKLIERKEDKSIVEEGIVEVFGEEDENLALKKASKKVLKGKDFNSLSRTEQQKILQKLLLRGFEYREIKDYFSSGE